MTVGPLRPQVDKLESIAVGKRCARWGWGCAVLVLLLSLSLSIGQAVQAQDSSAASSVDCEMRVVWGGSLNRTYAGTISIERGSLTPIRNLSLQSDSIGTIRCTDNVELQLIAHSPSQFGGVDVRVRGDLSSKIAIRMLDPFGGNVIEHVVALGELMQGNWLQAIDDRGARVAIERQMHDRIRIDTHREQQIYATGETWTAWVSGYRTGLVAGDYQLTAKLFQGSQLVNEQAKSVAVDADGSFVGSEWSFGVPEQEAAYDVEFSMTRKRFLNNIVSPNATIVRRIEFVALDPELMPERIVRWQPLLDVNMVEASKPGSLAWLNSLNDIPSLVGVPKRWQLATASTTKAIVTHGEVGSRATATDISCLTVAPESWVALPLSGLKVGVAHRLNIQLPTDLPMRLAISMRGQNIEGDFPAINVDSGFAIDDRECNDDGRLANHELIFWPKPGINYVLFANADDTKMASIGSVGVHIASVERTEPVNLPKEARRVGLCLDKPLLGESFSATNLSDLLTRRTLNSWSTWFEAAERLEQYMDTAETDTLVLKVFADGGAIFPSQRLQPSRRFDSGTFFSDGRCPDIKDSIEVLLRRFDRTGKRLILSIDFDSVLPELPQDDERGDALVQRNVEGVAWPAQKSFEARQRTRYNPLNTFVQAEITAVMREIVGRYATHPSFAGIVLQMDQESHLVFAGDKWGYDQETLNRWAQASQVKLPSPEKLPEIFASTIRLSFLQWRASEMTKFYADLSTIIRNKNPEAKLYLNTVRLWETYPTETDFYSPRTMIRSPREYLMAYGVDSDGITKLENVALMHGSLHRSWSTENQKDWVLDESSARASQIIDPQMDAAFVVYQPQGFKVPGIDQLGGMQRNPSSQWIFPHLNSYSSFARKELIAQLYNGDPQLLISGSWLPVLGQEAEVRGLYRTIRQLPPIAMQNSTQIDAESNLRVRVGDYQGKAYVQLVNFAPWTERVFVKLDNESAKANVRVLGDRETEELFSRAAPLIWEIRVPPYDMCGLEVDATGLQIMEVAHSTDISTTQRLGVELQMLESVIDEAGDPTRHGSADIGGEFENWSSDGKPLGWSVSALPKVQVYRSTELPHSGKSSLVIENGNAANVAAWVQSYPLEPPQTGRLAVQAWLRSQSTADPVNVRLSVVGRLANGERFERSQYFGGTDNEHGIAYDWGRRPASLYVADIPVSEMKEMYVAIDLVGPGKVWVDDVQVTELRLHPDERIYLRGQVLVAKQKLLENNPFPAELLLDSNWGHYLSSFREADNAAERVAEVVPLQTSEEALKADSDWNQQKPILQHWRDSLRDRWRR